MTALEKITKARISLIMTQPFFATVALHLRMVEDATCKTFWTDGERIGYNPRYAETLTLEEVKGVIAHEVMHVVNLHHLRQGDRLHDKWNRAADYAINPLVQEAGFVLPSGCLSNARFFDHAAEQIYPLLPDEDDGEGGGIGEVRPFKGGESEKREAEAQTRKLVHQAAQAAKMQGALSEGLERAIKHGVRPRVNWRAVLQQFVSEMARRDYSWRRANPRFAHLGVIMPTLDSPQLPPITIGVDTSGSIGQNDLDQFASEISEIMRLWNVQMRVLYCDSQINGEVTFNPGEQVKLEPKGGGGTSFAPVMKEVMRGAPTTCLIYFTDLCCSTFGEDPGCPVLWVQHGADGFLANYAQQPPFGEVIPMEQQHEDRRMVQTA